MEEVDLSSQHVGEACSSFVDVVVATDAAKQFGPRCPAGYLERGRDGRNGVCLGNDEQERYSHGGGASNGSTPREAKQRPSGDAVVPRRSIFWGHELFSERAVRRGAHGQLARLSVTGNVDWLATKQGAETVEQGEHEETGPVLERGHHCCGQAVGERGLGDRCD